MSVLLTKRCGMVVAALAAAGTATVSLPPAAPAHAAGEALTCDIEVSRSGALVGLKAVVISQGTAAGRYRLQVTSSGANSSEINQSGDFSVSGGPSVVSTVNLGGRGSYTARLAVTVDGRTTECSQRVSGGL